tara:strand:- start:3082 stop:4419 length:1338 start_codon:yes stop_codon:yes gene_type:complete
MGLLDNTTQQQYYSGNDLGNYQFVSLNDIINQFMIAYVGEEKIISKASRTDIAFHAQRALAELSFDTFKSTKSQEIEVNNNLTMILPHDYVNYTKISWVDASGLKHPLYPTKHTSNPSLVSVTNDDNDYTLQAVGTLDASSSDIVLDDEYKDILVGMIVKGPYIPDGTFVRATSNSSSITTITIDDGAGTNVLPTESNSGTTLTFENADGSLIIPKESSHVVENLDWNTTDFKINANAAADIENIKVGMLVSHDNFPVGTTVTNINDTTIVVSNLPDTAVSSNAGEVTFIETGKESTSWSRYKSSTPSENVNDDYTDNYFWPNEGRRYGLEPSHAQVNGSFYIDEVRGNIHFSSNVNGKTVVLDYISDSLGTDDEMKVHKLAEEAMYKCIAYAVLSTRINTPEYIVQRFKKERFAATRQAKLRLSNIKLEEITQILRGKSKHIKH